MHPKVAVGGELNFALESADQLAVIQSSVGTKRLRAGDRVIELERSAFAVCCRWQGYLAYHLARLGTLCSLKGERVTGELKLLKVDLKVESNGAVLKNRAVASRSQLNAKHFGEAFAWKAARVSKLLPSC